ncbi:Uncharacterised protein [Vibrio cholerae]|nr:Uncharacterised protein [Vibrio cholerae]
MTICACIFYELHLFSKTQQGNSFINKELP